MSNQESNLNIIHLCQKCSCIIQFGDPYYSINRTLEFESTNSDTGETEIEIKDDDQIITLCINCGSYFNTSALETILNHLPNPGQEYKN